MLFFIRLRVTSIYVLSEIGSQFQILGKYIVSVCRNAHKSRHLYDHHHLTKSGTKKTAIVFYVGKVRWRLYYDFVYLFTCKRIPFLPPPHSVEEKATWLCSFPLLSKKLKSNKIKVTLSPSLLPYKMERFSFSFLIAFSIYIGTSIQNTGMIMLWHGN